MKRLLPIIACLCMLVCNFIAAQAPPPPCSFNSTTFGPVVSGDIDTVAGVNGTPYMATLNIFTPALGSIVEVTAPLTLEICFWGDLNGANETFNVTIAGQTQTFGAFGTNTSAGNPVCQNLTITNLAALETDLADGDIDITYDGFGSGFTINPLTGGNDDFNAQVRSFNLPYEVPVTINDPADRCTNGDNITWTATPLEGIQGGDNLTFQILPFTPGFDVDAGTLDVSEADPGVYTITAKYTVNGCDFRASTDLEIFPTPIANLKDTKVSCISPGATVNLSVMFDGANSAGDFAITSGTGGSITGEEFTPAAEGGCYTISYTALDPDGCSAAPITDEASLSVSYRPVPTFTIGGATSPACSAGGTVALTFTSTSGGPNEAFTVNGAPASAGVNNLAGPATTGSITYDICLTGTTMVPACGTLTDTTCVATTCQRFVVYNDGNDCGSGTFPSECPPDLEAVDVCDVDIKNNLSIQCNFINLEGPQLIEAELTSVPGLLTCEDEDFGFDWQGSLPGELGDAATGGPTIRQLNDVTEAICFLVVDFELCIPLPFVDDICIDPIPLPSVEEACGQTVGQFVADLIADAVGGPGGSGMIVVDTDGDGAFDFALEDYTFPASGTATMVPNNIQDQSGVITVRNVTAWPYPASDVCGEVSGESINLIELLPIGAIPIVGVIIEDLLAAASCNVELVFTDEATVQIPVINSSAPEFASCNLNGYVFSEDGICDTEVNWSIPVAFDGCGGQVLAYQGHTAAVDVTLFAGTPTPPVVVADNGSGIYQIAGPLPGSDLPVGTYSVTYAAYSCGGIETTCTFPVVVTSGDPVLVCPADVILKANADECVTTVSGFEALQGPGCNTVINYSIVFPDGSTAQSTTPFVADSLGTNNNISGQTFPLGVSTVTYTLEVDINGDGNTTGPGEVQTCDFTVEVTDNQRPVAECIDLEVKLDNTGNVTIFAEDQMDGTLFLDGGSTDNCDTDLDILIGKASGGFGESVSFDCTETGYRLVNLQVTDDAGNQSTCISQVYVEDFFEGIQFDLDIPELCLEANNPSQLDFSNYLIITLPDGTTISADEVENNTYLGDAVGAFGITAFAPSAGSASADPGFVSTDGAFTPGDGTGFVTVSYALALPNAVVQNDNVALTGCLEIVHAGFELRQPLDMEAPECECIVQNDRIVDLGEVSGGLEPYTIQYGGVKLDVDSDGVADDVDGTYTYDVANGSDIADFTEDLGNLLVDYTQPTWSFTIVDARGCELFRSGSCDNDDETGGPEIDCTALGAVTLYTRNEPLCEVQDTWTHTLPTDNCDVILYTYTIENPDGTIAGPFDLTALLNPDITNPLPDQFIGEYDFEHNSPTQNVSTVTYYAEDAVGNFAQCSFTVTVIDDDPPRFINCPEPAVIVDAPATWCSAFANYSLPLAQDNCGSVVVTQVDTTGLTSGDLFPVGITVNTFEAVDETGNTIRCDVKIIVNDFHTPPTIECPEDVVGRMNDEGDCGAIVEGIAPSGITDNCPDNLTVVYRIDDEDGNELSSGFDDASGTFFDLGTSTVSYSVQDMPLLLITEVTHEFSNTVDGAPVSSPSCFDGIQNGDETGVDCGGSSCFSCNCTDNEVTVDIVLDGNPEETIWAITEPNDTSVVLASGGPYAPGTTNVLESICLPDGCYDFVIRDTNLDGIAAGGGSYTVSTGTGVLASGGDFGAREVTNFCLDGTPTPAAVTGTAASRDALEITNFGSANLDVSCLMIERLFAGGSETYSVPTGAILAPGGVLTIYFGNGHDDPANNIFNVPGATDLAIAEPTAYVLSLSRSILDVLVLNDFDISGLMPPAYNLGGLALADYWSGASVGPVNGAGVVRTTVWDTNTSEDFAPSEACLPITIGMLNPWLAQPTPNGGNTAIQAQPTVRVECNFTVEIVDEEPAVCGLYSDYFDYVANDIIVEFGDCIETTFTVADDFKVADVNLNISGLAGDLGNLTVTLISPEGTEIELFEAICAGTDAIEFTLDGDFGPAVDVSCGSLNNAGELFVPVGDIEAFNGEDMLGDWILQIGHNGQESTATADLDAILFISARDPYDQGDVTLENDPGFCSAEFTYFHPILFDNCPGGEVLFQIIFEDDNVELMDNLPIFPENTEFTYDFRVGVSTVLYTLTDSAGNVSSCGFDVTVLDTENPTLVCPSDTTLQLLSGECDIRYTPSDWSTDDNCFVSDTIVVPSFTTPLPIGVNVITLTVQDSSGNDTTCMYTVTVLENIPDPVVMACITNINVHLGPSCEQEIIPQMVLTGDDFFCFDNYEVTLFVVNPDGSRTELPTNFVGLDEVGLEIIYEVYEPRTDQVCWGYIDVGFFEAPIFSCPADTFISCNALSDPTLLGTPIVMGCAEAGNTITFADTIVRNGICDDPRAILYRTWTVTDDFGNSGSCTQTITFEAFDLNTVIFPEDLDDVTNPAINCVDAINNPSLTDPINSGFPTVADGTNIFQANYCSASFLYTDEVYEICPGSYEILRTWKVRNTCLPVIPGVNPRESIQIIRVLDNSAPILTCPANDTISTGPFGCDGTYAVPAPVVETGCSDFTYNVTTNGGDVSQLPNGTFVIANLSLGTYTVRYEVEDECGRYSECVYLLTVNDEVSGTAICEDGLNVSLNTQGQGQLTAADIDGGSDDLCGTVELSIRRTLNLDPTDCSVLPDPILTNWGPTVDLNCCDVPDSLVNVELRVIDEEGNVSTCWTTVLVEDKLAPICLPPNNIQISCLDLQGTFPANLNEAFMLDPEGTAALLDDQFGTATAVDNCSEATITQTVQDSRTTCGIGQIVRSFTVTDEQGLFNATACIQQVLVLPLHDYTIILPGDQESDDCIEPDYNGVVIQSASCDLFTIATSRDTFTATADECYKIRIDYEILNWCEYNTLSPAYQIPRDADNDGILDMDTTVLHVIGNSAGLGDDIALLDRDVDRTNFNTIDELDTGDGGLVPGSTPAGYASDPSRGYFEYFQYIKVYDDTPPTLVVTEPDSAFCSFSVDCTGDAELFYQITDECSPASLSAIVELDAFINPNADGVYTLADFVNDGGDVSNLAVQDSSGNVTLNLDNLPIGEHAIRIRVSDGCGNTAIDLIVFEIVDCKAPTPICINGLTATLMPDGQGGGMAAIWANDFIASGSEDCSGPVKFAIYRQSDVLAAGQGFAPSVLDTGLVLGCDDLGPIVVRIYAIDAAGQSDYCETSLSVQAFNPAVCNPGDNGSLSGLVMTAADLAVEGVEVSISNDATGPMMTQMTTALGSYQFNDLALGEDYTLTAQSNPPVSLVNVSTGDLVLISRHILSIAEFTSPFQELAADVNRDGIINVVDMIQIRRVILGLDAAYPLGDSWSFHAVIDNEIVSSLNYNDLDGNYTGADFIAVERGNVSDALAEGNGFSGSADQSRSATELVTTDVELIAGEEYFVTFEGNNLAGWQGSFELRNGLEFIGLSINESLDAGYNLDRVANGVLALSVVDNDASLANQAREQFTLQLRATQDGLLSEFLTLSDRITRSEAYHAEESVRQLGLSFNGVTSSNGKGFMLSDNAPNPFKKLTTIRYQLPEAYAVTLSVRDITGKVVFVAEADGGIGWNEFDVTAKSLGSAGVFTYTLQAGPYVSTRKMVVVR